MDKKESRLRRGRQTRIKIAQLKVNRLSVHRTNLHIYANLIRGDYSCVHYNPKRGDLHMATWK